MCIYKVFFLHSTFIFFMWLNSVAFCAIQVNFQYPGSVGQQLGFLTLPPPFPTPPNPFIFGRMFLTSWKMAWLPNQIKSRFHMLIFTSIVARNLQCTVKKKQATLCPCIGKSYWNETFCFKQIQPLSHLCILSDKNSNCIEVI